MKNLYILLFFLVIFPQNLEAQTDADVCDLQVDFTYAICIDSPGGCYVYKTVVSGGTPPYSYAWSTGTTQNEYTFAPASTYGGTCESVTITDGNGCVAVTAGIWGDYSETSFTIGSDTLIALNTLINFDLSTNDVFDTIDYQLIKAPLFGTLEF